MLRGSRGDPRWERVDRDVQRANARGRGCAAVIGVAFYAVQIYCDFSGYTDMAIACARLLGYELTVNFEFPYFAASITEFWRRWHISLTSWSRDYVYMPLLGVTRNPYAATVASFLMIGLWHELSLRYVFWALYHAGAVVASNYLVTLYEAAAGLVAAAGAPPEALVPLMRRTIEDGFELTGPIERGDWDTVDAHREAIRRARPDLGPLYDVLAKATVA